MSAAGQSASPTALEQSIATLCDAHGLLSVCIDYLRDDSDDHRWFTIGFQWRDASKEHGRGIAAGSGEEIATALGNALTIMMHRRGGSMLADEALPELAA